MAQLFYALRSPLRELQPRAPAGTLRPDLPTPTPTAAASSREGRRRPTFGAGSTAALVLGSLLARASARGAARSARVVRLAKKGKKQQKVVEELEPEDLILPAEGMTLGDLAQRIQKPIAGIITYFFAETWVR